MTFNTTANLLQFNSTSPKQIYRMCNRFPHVYTAKVGNSCQPAMNIRAELTRTRHRSQELVLEFAES